MNDQSIPRKPQAVQDRTALLERLLDERILLLDGAMGTMIQEHGLDEAGYRGARFADWPSDLKGNNDLLTLTQPEIIRDIHTAYFTAGSDRSAEQRVGQGGGNTGRIGWLPEPS